MNDTTTTSAPPPIQSYTRAITGFLIQGPANAKDIAAGLGLPVHDVLRCLHNDLLKYDLVRFNSRSVRWSLPPISRT